jgi:DNA repair exonuclease SbcCD ATPase subunit
MIQAEYQRFLHTLLSSPSSTGVHKFANLVLAHLNALVPLGTHQGQRVKHVSTLAQKEWGVLSEIIPTQLKEIESETSPITQLKELSVGPFRGFSREEVFDLQSMLVLIYGPNGTGKSSFCEALEYALLGSVAEADSKRFKDVQAYLKNAHTNNFTQPKLTGLNNEGAEISVTPHDNHHRFCFVEKNRIDSFSRIAAQAPAKQSELISTLFGLDAFNEFAKNFSADIDGRYIDVEGVKAKRLILKRQALLGSEQQIKLNENIIEQVKTETSTLANRYREGCTALDMQLEINGTEENPGKIQQLELELQKTVPQKSNLTIANFEAVKEALVKNLGVHKVKSEELTQASQQVSFKQLFEAVTQVQSNSPDNCPACQTPLNQVIENPYTRAGEELAKLQHLAKLQGDIAQLEQDVLQNLQVLSQIVNTCLQFYPTENKLSLFKVTDTTKLNVSWWNSLLIELDDNTTALQHLGIQVSHLEIQDQKADQAEQIRKVQRAELTKLRSFASEIQNLLAKDIAATKAIEGANKIIAEFDVTNATLITEVEQEKPIVARNKEIRQAYSDFVTKLDAYRKKLPGQLVANLGDLVVELYNAFNRNDAPTELMASIQLPLAQNQKLKISFQSEPAKYFDALHIMSEGHIRCVGLAILLAKNIKEDCPILIFDDPVNAIDDDHRESIRRTLFEDPYFQNKQIILTCHGEEFFKDIQNLLPAKQVRASQTLAFLPRFDEAHIQVDFNCAPRNYVVAALEHIAKNESRYALSKCRQALEALTKGKIWQYVSRYGDGNLSIKLRSAKAPIELRQLTEQLKSKINKGDFAAPDKNDVLGPIDRLLGVNGNSREWRYLNKGTHEEEDRSEFERHTVIEVVSAIEALDQVL